MPDERDVILVCANGHKKTVSDSNYGEWKASHGLGTAMMCRRCNDKEILLPLSEIPRPFLEEILAKAAKLDVQEAILSETVQTPK